MFKSSGMALLVCLALVSPTAVPAATSAPHLGLSPQTDSAAKSSSVDTWRISGRDRFATAAAVADHWSPGVDVVFVVNADAPEALLASSAAVANAAPLLYTRPGSVPGATMNALENLAPQQIVVVGPSGSVSDTVLSALSQVAETQRAWNGDLYTTAANLTHPSTSHQTAYLVSPTSPDALIGPAAAALAGGSVLLTPSDALHPTTSQLLSSAPPSELVVLGGQASVGDSVAQAAADAAGLAGFTRIAGSNRYDTAALVAEQVQGWQSVTVTNGEVPVDALAAGPLAGQTSAPLLVTRASQAPTIGLDLLSARTPSSLTVVGGSAAVSAEVHQEFLDAAAGSDAPPRDGWGEPTWRDEFDGTSVDASKWRVRDNDYLSYDWGLIEAEAVTLENGLLRIRMEELEEPVVKADGRERYWTTGYLDTIGLHEERYGRWEVRAQIPTLEGETRGVWPAFWLRNASVGEIDIMEAWGGPDIAPRNPNLHNTSRVTLHESTHSDGASKGWQYEHQVWPGQDPYDTPLDFHVWAVEYTPDYLKAYMDDELAVHITPDMEHVNGVPGDYSWVWGPTFQQPWNMRLNMQMGSNWGTPGLEPSPHTVMPADFLVDYVRFYSYTE